MLKTNTKKSVKAAFSVFKCFCLSLSMTIRIRVCSVRHAKLLKAKAKFSVVCWLTQNGLKM